MKILLFFAFFWKKVVSGSVTKAAAKDTNKAWFRTFVKLSWCVLNCIRCFVELGYSLVEIFILFVWVLGFVVKYCVLTVLWLLYSPSSQPSTVSYFVHSFPHSLKDEGWDSVGTLFSSVCEVSSLRLVAKVKENLQSLSFFQTIYYNRKKIWGIFPSEKSVNLNIYEGIQTCLLLVRVLAMSTPLW